MVSSCGGWSIYNFWLVGPSELSYEEQTATYTQSKKRGGDYHIKVSCAVSSSDGFESREVEYIPATGYYVSEWFSVALIDRKVIVNVKENNSGYVRKIRVNYYRPAMEPGDIEITQKYKTSD